MWFTSRVVSRIRRRDNMQTLHMLSVSNVNQQKKKKKNRTRTRTRSSTNQLLCLDKKTPILISYNQAKTRYIIVIIYSPALFCGIYIQESGLPLFDIYVSMLQSKGSVSIYSYIKLDGNPEPVVGKFNAMLMISEWVK